MRNPSQDTAVLYFTRSASEEARVKSFCGSSNFAQNKAVAQKLINHTYRQIQTSGLPYRVFTSAAQHGNTFGEKFANAFQSLFDQGYENVIAVGNDCIQLSSQTIKYAAEMLRDEPVVAGPTTDGGTYLLGITRKAFHHRAFTKLAWETNRLLDDVKQYALCNGCELNTLSLSVDIDNEGGLRQALRKASSKAFFRRLVLLIQSIICSAAYRYHKQYVILPSCNFYSNIFHRGPPSS